MKEQKYNEIFELFVWLIGQEIPCVIDHLYDGMCIEFFEGDVVQHKGSYGSDKGYVEFGFTGLADVDFCAKTLDEAKAIILNNRRFFETGKKDET